MLSLGDVSTGNFGYFPTVHLTSLQSTLLLEVSVWELPMPAVPSCPCTNSSGKEGTHRVAAFLGYFCTCSLVPWLGTEPLPLLKQNGKWQLLKAGTFCLLYCIFQLLTDTCIPTPQPSSHGATCAFRDLIGKHPVKLSGNALIDSLL